MDKPAITVTDRQIRDLRSEAESRDDAVQVALCDLALLDATDMSTIVEVDESVRGKLERLGVIPEHVDADERARALCADAINRARAQEEV